MMLILFDLLLVDKEKLMDQVINLSINVRGRVRVRAVIHPPLVDEVVDIVLVHVGWYPL